MEIYYANNQSDLKIDEQQVKRLVQEVVRFEGQAFDEVSIQFVDTPAICLLHEEFFGDPSPTDCISFPIDENSEEGYKVLGELFVCPHAAIEYVRANNGDPWEETSLYIVHALLHLMGYDDIEEHERALMREAEAKHISRLKKKKLLLEGVYTV